MFEKLCGRTEFMTSHLIRLEEPLETKFGLAVTEIFGRSGCRHELKCKHLSLDTWALGSHFCFVSVGDQTMPWTLLKHGSLQTDTAFTFPYFSVWSQRQPLSDTISQWARDFDSNPRFGSLFYSVRGRKGNADICNMVATLKHDALQKMDLLTRREEGEKRDRPFNCWNSD